MTDFRTSPRQFSPSAQRRELYGDGDDGQFHVEGSNPAGGRPIFSRWRRIFFTSPRSVMTARMRIFEEQRGQINGLPQHATRTAAAQGDRSRRFWRSVSPMLNGRRTQGRRERRAAGGVQPEVVDKLDALRGNEHRGIGDEVANIPDLAGISDRGIEGGAVAHRRFGRQIEQLGQGERSAGDVRSTARMVLRASPVMTIRTAPMQRAFCDRRCVCEPGC